jgi:hypothetical protein
VSAPCWSLVRTRVHEETSHPHDHSTDDLEHECRAVVAEPNSSIASLVTSVLRHHSESPQQGGQESADGARIRAQGFEWKLARRFAGSLFDSHAVLLESLDQLLVLLLQGVLSSHELRDTNEGRQEWVRMKAPEMKR